MVFNFDVGAIWRSGRRTPLFYVTILATLRIKGFNWAGHMAGVGHYRPARRTDCPCLPRQFCT